MTTMTRVHRSKGKIRELALNGVRPSVATVNAGKYSYTRDAYFVTKADPSPKVAAFLEFMRSAKGASILKANSAIPVHGR